MRQDSILKGSAGCLILLLCLAACSPVTAAAGPTPTAMDPGMTMTAPTQGPNLADGTASTEVVSGPHVTIDNFTFSPQTLTVTVGMTVTWINQDDTPHRVASVDKVFASDALDTGDRYSYRFTAPGTYRYYCSIHPKMTATIIVQ